MFRKMIEASLDRVVRSMVTDEVLRECVDREIMSLLSRQGMRDAVGVGIACRITAEQVAACFDVRSVASWVDCLEIAEHLDVGEIAEHVDMQEVTNAVCENVTPDEIVDCLLQRVG